MGGLQRLEHRLEQMISGRVRPRLPLARCSPSRSPPRSSASATTTRRSCPATAGWCPTTSTSSSPAADLERLAPYDNALADELVDQLARPRRRSRATSSPGRCSDRLRGGRGPHHRPVPDPQPRPGQGHRQRPAHTQVGRARAVLEVNGTRHPLQPPGLVVGRGTEADLRINDPGVSRRHVEFTVTSGDGLVEVDDLGSTNGMLVDGHRGQPRRPARRLRGADRQHHDDRPRHRGGLGRCPS